MSEKQYCDHLQDPENHSEGYDLTIVKDEWMETLDADEPFIPQVWETTEDLKHECDPLMVKEEESEFSEDSDYQCGPVKVKPYMWDQQRKISVITLIKGGKYSPSKAGVECGVPPRTARRWWKQYLETGHVRRSVGSGRRRVSSVRDDRRLLDSICSKPFLSVHALGEISLFPGSAKTVARRLKNSGLCSQRAATAKQHLTVSQKIDRMAFAEEYMNFDWSRVIFSDKKVFSSTSNASCQVSSSQGGNFSPTFPVKKERNKCFYVFVWGCISAQGAGPLWRIDDVFSRESYFDILDCILKPSLEMLYPEGEIYFMQDDSAVHQCITIQKWFEDHQRIKIMPFVPRSSDLNPMENMWAEVTRSLPPNPTSTEDLWTSIENMWWKINDEPMLSNHLALSMPGRLQAVLRRKGGWICS